VLITAWKFPEAEVIPFVPEGTRVTALQSLMSVSKPVE
jgi:hypothetical protein